MDGKPGFHLSDFSDWAPMAMPERGFDITVLLDQIGAGNRNASIALFPAIYDELRALAGGYLAGERIGHTLQATALVNEAYLKLVGQPNVRWQNRQHFFRVAAKAMRQILVDHARSRDRRKRGGGITALPLDSAATVAAENEEDFVALDSALTKFAVSHPEAADVVEMRFFGGMTWTEIAEAIDRDESTVARWYDFAKSWLKRELCKV